MAPRWPPRGEVAPQSAAEYAEMLRQADVQHYTDFEREAAAGNLEAAIHMRRPGERFGAIAQWFAVGFITPEQVRDLLSACWLDMEWVTGYATTPVTRLFRAAGFVRGREPSPPPPTEISTIYRGAGRGGRRGVSWSPSLEAAQWHANRRRQGGENGRVWAAEIAPRHVLGVFGAPQGAKFVVNPRALRHLREIT